MDIQTRQSVFIEQKRRAKKLQLAVSEAMKTQKLKDMQLLLPLKRENVQRLKILKDRTRYYQRRKGDLVRKKQRIQLAGLGSFH